MAFLGYWKDCTVVTLIYGTNALGKPCMHCKSFLITGGTQKWSGHSHKEMYFLSMEVFKWILNGHLMLGIMKNMFECSGGGGD